MAKFCIFAVRDEKTSSFLKPFIDSSVPQAVRGWTEACNEPSSPFCKFPEDFTLYQLGSVDDENGAVSSLTVPVMVGTALSVKRAPQEQASFRNVN